MAMQSKAFRTLLNYCELIRKAKEEESIKNRNIEDLWLQNFLIDLPGWTNNSTMEFEMELDQKYKYITKEEITEIETTEQEKETYGVHSKKIKNISHHCPICNEIFTEENVAYEHSAKHELNDLTTLVKLKEGEYSTEVYFETEEQAKRFVYVYEIINGGRYTNFELSWSIKGWYTIDTETKNMFCDDERYVHTFIYDLYNDKNIEEENKRNEEYEESEEEKEEWELKKDKEAIDRVCNLYFDHLTDRLSDKRGEIFQKFLKRFEEYFNQTSKK